MKYLISVIIPMYNSEKFIARCIDSILKQTIKIEKIQIIIVNDGSQDNSKHIVEKYMQTYNNIVLIDKKNEGVSKARNTGISLAKGKYISFVDSDDYIDCNMFKELCDMMEYKGCDIAISNMKFVTNNKLILKESILDLPYHKKVISNYNALKYLLNYKIDGYMCNKVFKKDLFINNNIKFPENKTILEDMITLYKAIIHSKLIYITENCYYNYVQHGSSITKMPKKNSWEHIVDNVIGILDILKNQNEKHLNIEKELIQFKLKQVNIAIYYFWINNSFKDIKIMKKRCNSIFTYKDIINKDINKIEVLKFLILRSYLGKIVVLCKEKRKKYI